MAGDTEEAIKAIAVAYETPISEVTELWQEIRQSTEIVKNAGMMDADIATKMMVIAELQAKLVSATQDFIFLVLGKAGPFKTKKGDLMMNITGLGRSDTDPPKAGFYRFLCPREGVAVGRQVERGLAYRGSFSPISDTENGPLYTTWYTDGSTVKQLDKIPTSLQGTKVNEALKKIFPHVPMAEVPLHDSGGDYNKLIYVEGSVVSYRSQRTKDGRPIAFYRLVDESLIGKPDAMKKLGGNGLSILTSPSAAMWGKRAILGVVGKVGKLTREEEGVVTTTYSMTEEAIAPIIGAKRPMEEVEEDIDDHMDADEGGDLMEL